MVLQKKNPWRGYERGAPTPLCIMLSKKYESVFFSRFSDFPLFYTRLGWFWSPVIILSWGVCINLIQVAAKTLEFLLLVFSKSIRFKRTALLVFLGTVDKKGESVPWRRFDMLQGIALPYVFFLGAKTDNQFQLTIQSSFLRLFFFHILNAITILHAKISI